jgi:hypothetical protein
MVIILAEPAGQAESQFATGGKPASALGNAPQ